MRFATPALLLASLTTALATASAYAQAAEADAQSYVEHVTTSSNTGGTRHRAAGGPLIASPAPSGPVAATPPAPPPAPVAPAPPRPPKAAAAPATASPPAPIASRSTPRPAMAGLRSALTRNGAIVRKRPALDGQVLARLATGTSVDIETELQNDEDSWWYVSTPTVSGWIAARELDVK